MESSRFVLLFLFCTLSCSFTTAKRGRTRPSHQELEIPGVLEPATTPLNADGASGWAIARPRGQTSTTTASLQTTTKLTNVPTGKSSNSAVQTAASKKATTNKPIASRQSTTSFPNGIIRIGQPISSTPAAKVIESAGADASEGDTPPSLLVSTDDTTMATPPSVVNGATNDQTYKTNEQTPWSSTLTTPTDRSITSANSTAEYYPIDEAVISASTIVFAIAGAFVVSLLIAVCAYLCWRYNKTQKNHKQDDSSASYNVETALVLGTSSSPLSTVPDFNQVALFREAATSLANAASECVDASWINTELKLTCMDETRDGTAAQQRTESTRTADLPERAHCVVAPNQSIESDIKIQRTEAWSLVASAHQPGSTGTASRNGHESSGLESNKYHHPKQATTVKDRVNLFNMAAVRRYDLCPEGWADCRCLTKNGTSKSE